VLPLNNCQAFPQPPQYQPVIFYFYSFEVKKPSLTFCQPSLSLWNVVAGVDMTTGLVNNVTLVDQNVPHTNVSGLPGFNGVAFDLSNADSYTQARAVSIKTAVPFAIYKGVMNEPGGIKTVIQQPDGMLNMTTLVYTRFLALAAKNVYFVGTDELLVGSVQTSELRLWVYPLFAHVFAACLLFIAVVASLTHVFHVRARRDVFVSCDASTIAGALSMTSMSSFPRLLHAGMDEDDLHRALKGMRFGISPTTWQIVAQEDHGFGK